MEIESKVFSASIASVAVQSLIEELELTPKPGLVDQNNTGSHSDLTCSLMRASAESLKDTFKKIAYTSYGRLPSQSLREEIAEIGRAGEKQMFEVTNGINTHKGAIWAIGLLTSAVSMGKGTFSIEKCLSTAGKLASYPDRYCPKTVTNGRHAMVKYGVNGAKGEAQEGFPHIRKFSLPMLYQSRKNGLTDEQAKLNSLLSLIATVEDTCILHRGGIQGLEFAKEQACSFLKSGNFDSLNKMDQEFIKRNISPGGSADLLAATLFLDKTEQMNKGRELKEYHCIR
ncbi:triphosphoribosyl-dephospho-CoA synthase [Metabacillus sp. B2-18]|uniref:triphosphoribosyl-dephospho-CoA synthase n=1 Tax=Metabacillus sp. B2-18 TaxID=2897333 RepID=UPI001E63A8A1|nr:triphosphoribosyl-dephospho-CoA synthase [Metabacillus sp. B2-18]UGB33054.1 triphosphoribosyl-dephospho-CoA synthase [Metabacillus sp. B2-18]